MMIVERRIVVRKSIKTLLTAIVIVICIISLTGCKNEKSNKTTNESKKTIDSKVVGTWKYEDEGISGIYVFKKDGTGSYTMTVEDNVVEKDVDYYTKKGKLYINYNKDPDTFEMKYTIKDEGIIIYDSFGEELLYKKQ